MHLLDLPPALALAGLLLVAAAVVATLYIARRWRQAASKAAKKRAKLFRGP